MGRLVKFVLWFFAGLAGLLVIAAVALNLFFDPNDFRGDISAAVKSGTGRDLVIEGDISLEFFPWLAIEVGETRLGNAPGFGDAPMARFERARLRVKVMPLLLHRKITVGTVIVEGLELNLRENSRGATNWEDLVADGAPGTEQVESGRPADIQISGIEFLDASISYQVGASGPAFRLRDVTMKIGRISGAEKLTIDGLTLEGTVEGITTDASKLKFTTGAIEIQTAPQLVTLQALELDVSDVAIADVLTSISIHASARLTSKAFELSDITMKIDDITFTGNLSVPTGSSGAYEFDLVADAIDLTRYMEPASDTSSDAAADSETLEIPVDLIRPVKARGNLKIARATLGNIVLENVELGLNARNGRLRLHPISADLFGGTYRGDVSIDVAGKTSVLTVNEKIAGVDLASLAKAMFDQENITGTIDGSFALSGKGDDVAAIQRSLAGNMSFELRDGTYEGTDIWYELRRARALIKGAQAPEPVLPAKTEFSVVRASGRVTDGVLHNNDLFAELPFMQITGAGQVDLSAGSIDYRMTARILERPEFLRDATAAELDEFTQAVIPLKITGSLAAPDVRPDLEKLLRKRVEDEIKDKLRNKLRDFLGG